MWYKPLMCFAMPKLLINIDKVLVISIIFVLIPQCYNILTKIPAGIRFVFYVVTLAGNLDV